MLYAFNVGDRVYCSFKQQYGEIESMVPGNGIDPWYYVRFDDGTIERFTVEDLTN